MAAMAATANTDGSEWAQAQRTARLPALRMRYRLLGAGTPVVLLHGWPQTSHEWRHVATALSGDHLVIVPDLRGLGDSTRPATGYDKQTLAEDVWALLDGLGIENAAIVGHDLGAAVGYRVACTRPQSVSHLVSIEMMMPGFGVEEEFAMQDENGIWHLAFHMARDIPEALVEGRERLYLSWFFRTFAHRPERIGEADLDEYVRCYQQPGALRAGFEYYRTLFQDGRENRRSSAEPLTMPVLAVGGEHSMGARVADSIRALAPGAIGQVIPACGHWVPEEQPELLSRILAAFLAGSPSGRHGALQGAG